MTVPEMPWGRVTRGRGHLLGWLTGITVVPAEFGADREAIRLALEAEDIQSRPLWKPMHLQPVFAPYECVGGAVAEALFRAGLCLPSGTAMSAADQQRVSAVIRSAAEIGWMVDWATIFISARRSRRIWQSSGSGGDLAIPAVQMAQTKIIAVDFIELDFVGQM